MNGRKGGIRRNLGLLVLADGIEGGDPANGAHGKGFARFDCGGSCFGLCGHQQLNSKDYRDEPQHDDERNCLLHLPAPPFAPMSLKGLAGTSFKMWPMIAPFMMLLERKSF